MFTTLRGILVLILIPILTGLTSLIAIIALLLFRVPQEKIQVLPRMWGKIILFLSGVEVELFGLENIEKGRPYIFAANHQSQFDIFALMGRFEADFRWLAKLELFQIPLFGYALRKAGNIPVDRAHGRKALKSLGEAAKKIAAGTSVIIFPEGTRSPDGKLLPFKAGTMVLAIKAGVPVVPMSISGTHAILPKKKLFTKPGKVVIRVGKPIDTAGYKVKQKHDLAVLLEEKVTTLFNTDQ